MAQSKLVIAFFLLAIILAHELQSTQGRHLKLKNKNARQTRSKISRHDSMKFTKYSKNISRDCSSVIACGNEAALAPQAPPSPVAVESQPPPPGHADDFRPTAPGRSPGIGHYP